MSNAFAGHIQEAAKDIQHNEDCQTALNQSLFSIESHTENKQLEEILLIL